MVKSINGSKKGLARSLEEIEMILDNIPGLVFYKDDKNSFIWVNEYIAEAYKMSGVGTRKRLHFLLFNSY